MEREENERRNYKIDNGKRGKWEKKLQDRQWIEEKIREEMTKQNSRTCKGDSDTPTISILYLPNTIPTATNMIE